MFELFVVLTFLTLILCLFGVGLLALPFITLLWILYFTTSLSIGTGVAIAGVVIAYGIYSGLKKRKQ